MPALEKKWLINDITGLKIHNGNDHDKGCMRKMIFRKRRKSLGRTVKKHCEEALRILEENGEGSL